MDARGPVMFMKISSLELELSGTILDFDDYPNIKVGSLRQGRPCVFYRDGKKTRPIDELARQGTGCKLLTRTCPMKKEKN